MAEETYDSWEGFKSAGFAEEDDGTIQLVGKDAWCSVRRGDARLQIQFGIDLKGILEHQSDFEFPLKMESLQHWAASFARLALGDRRKLGLVVDADDESVPRDLIELLGYGFDHEDSLPEAEMEDGEEECEDGDEEGDEPSAEGGVGISSFAAMRRVLEDTKAWLWSQMNRSSEKQDVSSAKESLTRLEKVDALAAKVDALESEWRALALPDPTLALDDADDDTLEEGEEVDEPDIPLEEPDEGDTAEAERESNLPKKGEDDRPRGHCTNFAVTFSDGTRISEAKASVTFAKTIDKIGPARVAALALSMAGDPLVTRDKSEIKKMPQLVQAVSDGWFVKTHSNTYTKMGFLTKIADALDVKLEFDLFRREPLPKPIRKGKRGRPRKPKPRDPNRFEIGRVVKWYFPKVFASGNVTDDEIALMLSNESKRMFGTRGYPVLKESDGANDDYIVNGQRRYYADMLLELRGRKFRLTSQFITSLCEPVLKWLESKGFSRSEMKKVGQGEEVVPGLFKDITVFASDAADEEKPQEETPDGTTLRLEAADQTPSLFDVLQFAPVDENAKLKASDYFPARDIKIKLRKIAKAHDYTPSILAQGLGLNRKEVKGWFKGRGIVKQEQLRALCRFMGVDAAEFGVGC